MNILLTIYWDINPAILTIGGFELRYYGLFFALGFLLSFYIVQWMFKKENIPLEELDKLTTYVILGAVVGARLGHILFYEPAWYFSHPIEILKVWRGGLASHGGTIGVILGIYLYARKYKRNFIWALDHVAVPTALTSALIRMGNLMNSEIYGGPTDLPWGFVFVREQEIVPKHPTQIYEALCYFGLFILLLFLYRRSFKIQIPKGKIVGIFLMVTFGSRFLIEFVKNVQADFEKTMLLNMGQLLSIPFILIGAYLFFKKWK